MNRMIHVGFGEYRISNNPDSVLVCFGLGSCVAVTFYDYLKKIGGMIHIVLPTNRGKSTQSPARFADTGIPLLLKEMIRSGASKKRLVAKLVGGAKIVKFQHLTEDFDIGFRNVQSCMEVLHKLGLDPDGQETGGHKGRTVRLHIQSGETYIRQQGEKQI